MLSDLGQNVVIIGTQWGDEGKGKLVDAVSGELLHSEDLGPQGTGLTGFNWTNIPIAVRESDRKIKVDISANTGKGMESIGPSVYAKVLSASSFGDASESATLDVQDYGTISASSVSRIR